MPVLQMKPDSFGDLEVRLPNRWTAMINSLYDGYDVQITHKSGEQITHCTLLYRTEKSALSGLNRLLKRLGWPYEVTL